MNGSQCEGKGRDVWIENGKQIQMAENSASVHTKCMDSNKHLIRTQHVLWVFNLIFFYLLCCGSVSDEHNRNQTIFSHYGSVLNQNRFKTTKSNCLVRFNLVHVSISAFGFKCPPVLLSFEYTDLVEVKSPSTRLLFA